MGQAARSLGRLWGLERASGPGPKPGLTLERIVASAIEIADENGLEAVSLRRVAEDLEVGAMSLYRYVSDKGELLELMYDKALGEEDWALPARAGWREKLETVARRGWAFYDRHPWMLEIPWAQAPLGPHALRSYDRALSAVLGTGLRPREMVQVIDLVATFLRGAAQAAADVRRAHERGGQSDAEWWQARAPFLESVMAPRRFPTLCRPEMAGAFEAPSSGREYYLAQAEDAFEFGLKTLLRGVEDLIRRRRGTRRDRPGTRPDRRGTG